MEERQQDHYQRLFDQVPIGLYVSAPDGRLLDANPALLEMLGYEDLEAFATISAEQLYANPEDRQKWKMAMGSEGVIRNYELQLRKADGATIWVKDNARAVNEETGEIAYYEGSLEDITERKQAEEELFHERELLNALMDNIPDLIYFKDIDSHFTRINKAEARLLKLENPHQAVGKTDFDFQLPDVARDAFAEEQQIVRTGKPVLDRSEFNPTPDGKPRWLSNTKVPIKDKDGRITGLVGISRDITDRKRIEESLQEQKRALHMVISSMPNLLIKVDENDRLSAFAAPPRFSRFLRTSEEPVGQPLAEMLPSGATDQILDDISSARETGKESTLEYSSTIDDKTVYFEIKISPVSGSREVLVVADNITERKLAELAEHDQRVLAEALRDIAILLNATLDLDQVLDRILANLERVVPYDAANIMMIDGDIVRTVGRRGYAERGIDELILSLRHSIAEIHNLKTMIETGRPFLAPDTNAYPGWVRYPQTEWINSSAAAPIRILDNTIGFINLDSETAGFFTEDHIRRLEAFAAQAAIAIQNAQLYQTLQEQTVELGVANRELEAFSHTVAHDLKAPLQVVVGYSSVLQQLYANALDEDGQTMVEEMKAATLRMGSMIESLLLLAKLRHVDEQLTIVDMIPVATAARDRFKNMITERGVQVEVAADMPQAIGYGPWLEEVFANLISNAIKYIGQDNPNPRIIVHGKQVGSLVRYNVQDNGLGISDKDQATLFEMFSRFHKDQASGLGLGLSIVQRIVTRLNGQLGVESAPGEGSTFWFTLSAVPPSGQKQ